MTTNLGMDDTLPFGIYKGQQVEDLLIDQPNYMAWLADENANLFDYEVLERIAKL